MKPYRFDTCPDRRQDGSFKYCASPMKDDPQIIPMWVADMDFATLPAVIDAIEECARFGVFGYTPPTEDFLNAAVRWLKERHDLEIRPEWIIPVPGVVPAIKVLIQALTEPGDEILILNPVYHPFRKSIEMNGRICVSVPLKETGTSYALDFDLLEKTLQEHSISMMIFCSPHNPVGKVWSEADQIRLGQLCVQYGVTMLSDEIHMDFARAKKHVPFLKACPSCVGQTIMAIAPTKTFNLAGLQVSILVAPNEEIHRKIRAVMERNGMESPSILAMAAASAAWTEGDEWVDALNETLERNIELVRQWTETDMPLIRLFDPEGLYLLWLDCRALGMSPAELEEFMTKEARVFFNQGAIFGPEGEGFVRMNIACPPQTVSRALDQITAAWKARAEADR